MNRTLITYFSCSGNTKNVALKLATAINADVFEIEPSINYTEDDLDWENKNSRSSVEMEDLTARPTIKNRILNFNEYDTIYLGFPIWWYVAPRIINTFLESYDFTNKKIYIFVTSGSSSIDNTYDDLKNKYPNLNFIKTNRFSPNISQEEIKLEINKYK